MSSRSWPSPARWSLPRLVRIVWIDVLRQATSHLPAIAIHVWKGWRTLSCMQISQWVSIVSHTKLPIFFNPEWRSICQSVRCLINGRERRYTWDEEVLFDWDWLWEWVLNVAVTADAPAGRKMISSYHTGACTTSPLGASYTIMQRWRIL